MSDEETQSKTIETPESPEEFVLQGGNSPQGAPEDAPALSGEEKARRRLYQQYMQQERTGQGKTKTAAAGFTAAAAAGGATGAGGAGFVAPPSSGGGDDGLSSGYSFRMSRGELVRYNTDKFCHQRINRHLHRAIKQALDNEWSVTAFNRGNSDKRDDLLSMYMDQRIKYLATNDTRETRRILGRMGYDPDDARERLSRLSVPFAAGEAQKEIMGYAVGKRTPPPLSASSAPSFPSPNPAAWTPPRV